MSDEKRKDQSKKRVEMPPVEKVQEELAKAGNIASGNTKTLVKRP